MKATAPYKVGDTLTRAMSLHQLGRLNEAESLYQSYLADEPQHVGVLTLLGTLHLQIGRQAEGIALLTRSLALNPRQPDACLNRGKAYEKEGRLQDALADFERAISLNPGFAEAHFNRGAVLKQLRRLDEAAASYARAIKLQPTYTKAYNNRGNILLDLGRYDEALRDFDEAVALQPDSAVAHDNRGNALGKLDRFSEAVASYDRAILLEPDYPDAHINRASTLRALKNYDAALADLDYALDIEATAKAYAGKGHVLQDTGRFNAALENYDQALAMEPDCASALFGKGVIKLMRGEWAEGWALYENRWRLDEMRPHLRIFTQPRWTGREEIAGKTILLHADQGFGDAIMAARYVPLLEARGAKVIVETPKPLAVLFKSISPAARMIVKGETAGAFDYHCALTGLHAALGITPQTVPAQPYLAADEDRRTMWRERLGAKTAPHVGIVWAGSGRYFGKQDFRRDVPLMELAAALVPGLDFICLQKDISESDRAMLATMPHIRSFDDQLTDFVDTAALASEMDLIVSVDTAVAHLAGALGLPVRILLADPPDYQWMETREDTPWYPSARLLRQTHSGEWGSVITRLAMELSRLRA